MKFILFLFPLFFSEVAHSESLENPSIRIQVGWGKIVPAQIATANCQMSLISKTPKSNGFMCIAVTAAHCVYDGSDGELISFIDIPGESLSHIPVTATTKGRRLAGKSVDMSDDIALLEFEQGCSKLKQTPFELGKLNPPEELYLASASASRLNTVRFRGELKSNALYLTGTRDNAVQGGDSGGGIFTYNKGLKTYELVGVITSGLHRAATQEQLDKSIEENEPTPHIFGCMDTAWVSEALKKKRDLAAQ